MITHVRVAVGNQGGTAARVECAMEDSRAGWRGRTVDPLALEPKLLAAGFDSLSAPSLRGPVLDARDVA